MYNVQNYISILYIKYLKPGKPIHIIFTNYYKIRKHRIKQIAFKGYGRDSFT